ncbi:hypothetical protein CAPTEDRAFT_208853 [Capitella teleta]|uniref:DDE-1 domain-containing protein n=1 Tax=Capitella teleta TaxID=283909 RepID=R7VKD0_CAPTE|nr:hypothetical protein CAPTEDRAFT_208853 [Capitella teleta]|eukprot:ELU17256.1 hypothetical protein CAPTEDRAFT_208853 [Capitella teleta]
MVLGTSGPEIFKSACWTVCVYKPFSKCRVLLLLDNASSHTPGVTFSHMTLRFLPPNTTSHIQQMDAGIIRNFKCFYRQQHVRHLVRCVEDRDCNINLGEAIAYISQAWGSVKRETISNCWRHTGLTSQPLNDTVDSESTVCEDIAELTSQLPIKNPMNAPDFIAVNDTEQTLSIYYIEYKRNNVKKQKTMFDLFKK